MKERKQAEYERHQYKKLLARHPPPPTRPLASLVYNWRSNCNPDEPPLDEDEYQPHYVDPCHPQNRHPKQPLSAPATMLVASKNLSSDYIQIGYDQASNSAPDAEMGC